MSSYDKVTWIAGFTTLFANFPLLIYSLYVNIFLREDLVTIIIIVTIIGALRNLLQIFLRIPLGELSQIIGRKPLIIAGHVSYTIALSLMFLATDWVLVLISTLFIGLGMSAFWPAIFGYLADVNIGRVGESTGRIFLLSDIGSIFSSLFAYFLLQELQFSLHGLFGAVALISIGTGMISMLLLPESLEKSERKQVTSIWKTVLKEWLTMIPSLKKLSLTNKLWQVYFFHFVIAFIEFTFGFFVPLMIVFKDGFSNPDVSAISLWALFLVFWLKPYLGKLTDRIEFIKITTISLTITSIVLFTFIFIDNFILLVGAYLIANASIMVSYFAANGETTRRAPIEYRGIALGVFGVYISVGRASSTLMLGPIWETFSLTGVFIFTPILIFTLTFLLYFVIKRNSNKSNPLLYLELNETE
jgi:MFS family permease